VFLCVIIGGMIALILAEGFSLLDAVYFLIVTIATVGYGDLYPVTPLGKITVIIVIICGVGVFISFVANSIEYLIDKRERAERLKKMNMIIGVLFSELGIRLLKVFGEKTRPSVRYGQLLSLRTSGRRMILKEHLVC
jgi:voltage-gated potassium channel Kch